jgi:putative ABC transport system ATP-binding protein
MIGAGIAVEALSKQYETPGGLVQALDAVSFEVEPGASVAITGPSGCGKSTLLGLLAGLEEPTSGRIVVGGDEISALGEGGRARLRRAALGLVFQADNLLPFLTVVENVGLRLALHGDRDGYERCVTVLEDLGLADQLEKLPDQLSGGQRQRVAVARALIHHPSLILADEPTGSLDAENSQAVVDLLLAPGKELNATLLVVTHDPVLAGRFDRRLSLRDGRLVDGVADDRGLPQGWANA